MARRLLCVVLAFSLLGLPGTLSAQSPVSDPEVVKGIRQVDDGDYDAAIFTLDAAARRLAADPSKVRDLSQAYLYLGIAYFGKGHEAAAKAKFREAVAQIKDLTLSPEKFPPKVINLFEAAKEEAGKAGPSPAPPAGTRPAAAPEKKGGGGKGLLIAGLVVAAGGGVALAVKGGGSSGQPSDVRKTETFNPGGLGDGAQRTFRIVVGGPGTLDATATWAESDAEVALDLQEANPPYTAVARSNRTTNTTSVLSAAVTAKEYLIVASNYSGRNVATFSLTVRHP